MGSASPVRPEAAVGCLVGCGRLAALQPRRGAELSSTTAELMSVLCFYRDADFTLFIVAVFIKNCYVKVIFWYKTKTVFPW